MTRDNHYTICKLVHYTDIPILNNLLNLCRYSKLHYFY